MQDFKDKVAVITGAGSGIGAGFAKKCVAENMKVVLADINQKNLDSMENDLTDKTSRDNLLFLKVDVSKKQDILSLVEKVKSTFGRVDLLFNQAGIPGPIGPIWKTSYDDIETAVKTNLLSVMYSLRAFLPMMLKQNTPGYIINTSSGAGLQLGYNMSCYMATKRAVIALSHPKCNN